MIFYPSTLPCVSKAEGLSATAFAGVIRTPMEAGNSRQRRAHRTLPHQLALAWDIAQKDLAAWITWVNAHAWDDWILLTLPGLAASQLGLISTSVPVRFVSDLSQELLPGHGIWYWRLRVDAEYQPSPDDLAPVSPLSWYVAGRPGSPAPIWIVAGRPGSPAPTWL